MPDDLDLGVLLWQIESRSKIQTLLHRMYALYKAQEQYLPLSDVPTSQLTTEEKDEWYPLNRMIGAAFSLWRSAFLTQASSNRQKIYDHTKEFVGKLLAQNAISFADDHKMCELTIVYYNANARYRIERLMDRNSTLVEKYLSVRAIEEMKIKGTADTLEEKEHWAMLYDALKDCFEDYEQRYSR